MVASNWETGAVLWKKTFGEAYNTRRKGKPHGVAAYAQAVCDGKIAVGTTDGRLFVIDLETGRQLIEWQATESMTQHLLVQGKRLVQLSWGEMKIWSLSDYSLVHTVRMFDRVATSVTLSSQSVICCGRDASEDGDLCGLDVSIKGWTFSVEQATDSRRPDTPETDTDRSKGRGTDVFNIGTPLRNAGDLQVLSDDRLVLNVLRGTLAALVLAATRVTTLVSPDVQRFSRDVKAEIYERDATVKGFALREDHPNPDMVVREVEGNVRRYVAVLMSRIHVDCYTLLRPARLTRSASSRQPSATGATTPSPRVHAQSAVVAGPRARRP
ncbi:hypothetical protein Sste5346_003706 [Sporothrix stenoceras]|uniref:Uncharacterized protein n=1 Tax=Sporothrix stenoceras TaxID=5173 RepID=A0ABR3ZBZ4_9PEZI